MGRVCVSKGRRCVSEMRKLRAILPRSSPLGSRAASLDFGFTLFPLGHSPRVSQNCGEVPKLGRVIVPA